jgi:hypothetical protein
MSAAPNADYYMNMSNALKRLDRREEGERDGRKQKNLRNASSEDEKKP